LCPPFYLFKLKTVLMKHTFLFKIAILAAVVFFSNATKAQMAGCNVFLQGNYLEAGINNNGAFGTSVNAPVGYHADVNDTMYNPCTLSYSVPLGLGFVADPNKTGWSTYYGDYIMPRTPNEGWGISDNSGTGFGYASYFHVGGATGFSGPVNGANTSFAVSGSTKIGTWAGQLTTDSLTFIQTTTVDTANLFLLQHILFVNAGSTTIDSFFYLRTANPHSDWITSLNYSTLNTIEDQLPNLSGLTLVSGKGTVDTSAYMAMATKNTNVRGFIIKHALMPVAGTFASIYYGDTANYMYGASDTLTEDGGIGLIWRFCCMGPGDSITLDYGYSFKGGVIDTALHVDTTSRHPLQLVNITRASIIAVYPNPTRDLLNISGLAQGDLVTIYDVFGRNILQKQMAGQPTGSVSLCNLATGTYLVCVKDPNGAILIRTAIQKK
jgi:type IX secretion system substrate protein